jgi:hypothetical protein
VELNTRVVRPYSDNFLNLAAECHSLVDDELQKLMWCRISGQEAKFLIDGATPSNNDTSTDLLEQTHERKVQVERE